jgi:hypothetical protein
MELLRQPKPKNFINVDTDTDNEVYYTLLFVKVMLTVIILWVVISAFYYTIYYK